MGKEKADWFDPTEARKMNYFVREIMRKVRSEKLLENHIIDYVLDLIQYMKL